MSNPVLGIDFGTTNTAAAWVDDGGKIHIVPVKEDSDVLPSVVSYLDNGTVLVGASARELIVDNPSSTISGVKRYLGRRYQSDFVGRNRGRVGYRLVEGPAGLTAVELRGEVVPLEDAAFRILSRIVELAQIAAGTPFERCAIAVPSHYTYRQRQVIRQVAERLLEVSVMIHEPTAAALYHTEGSSEGERNLLVYDLGGGTFDATVLKQHKNGVVEVLASGGDAFLGGQDFDNRLVERFVDIFETNHSVDLTLDVVLLQRLAFAAERAKIALSTDEETMIRVPCLSLKGDAFIDLEARIKRSELEALTAPLVEKTLGIAEDIVRQARLTPDKIDELVLVGGQTRMPAIRSRLAQRFRYQPKQQVDPELAVAIGAALRGSGRRRLVDVLSVPIGMMSPGLAPKTAVPKNAPLPCVQRVELVRPTPGQPLPLVFFEAVELTSIDRDILGQARVEASWLDDNPGDLALEVRMSDAFELGLAVHAKGGGRTALSVAGLEGTRPAPREAIGEPPGPPAAARTSERAEVSLPVRVRLKGGRPIEVRAENASLTGLFIRTNRPLPLQARILVEIETAEGPVALPARVVRAIHPDAARLTGMAPGIGVAFEKLHDAPRKAWQSVLSAASAGAPAGDSGDSGALTKDLPTTKSDPTERVRQFVRASSDNLLYEAFGVEPDASDTELRAAVESFAKLIADLLVEVSGPLQARLRTVRRIVDRTAGILLDVEKRLEYDFQSGHVRADERIAAAESGAGPSLAVLREAWHRAHPDRVDQADLMIARALQAARGGDTGKASEIGQLALVLDPFNSGLRIAIERWLA